MACVMRTGGLHRVHRKKPGPLEKEIHMQRLGRIVMGIILANVASACVVSSDTSTDGGPDGGGSGGATSSSGGGSTSSSSGGREHPGNGQSWTILVYMTADNNLEPDGVGDLLE